MNFKLLATIGAFLFLKYFLARHQNNKKLLKSLVFQYGYFVAK